MNNAINIGDILNEIRARRWIKSILIFLPVLWVSHVVSFQVYQLFIGFCALSLTSSIVYIFNDIKDRELDRKHPKKKFRPIASGRMSVQMGVAIAFVLAIAVAGLLLVLNIPQFTLVVIAMLVLNTLYTNFAKNIPYIELIILGSLYALRVAAGFLILGMTIPVFAMLFIVFTTMFMKALQRYIEMKKYGDVARKVLAHYSESAIRRVLVIVLMLGVIFYHLTVSFITGPVLLTDIFVISVLFYLDDLVYSAKNIEKLSDNLVELVLSNRLLLTLVLIAVASLLIMRYWV